jgi:hypothetical protein
VVGVLRCGVRGVLRHKEEDKLCKRSGEVSVGEGAVLRGVLRYQDEDEAL